jgi:hypothetical protein
MPRRRWTCNGWEVIEVEVVEAEETCTRVQIDGYPSIPIAHERRAMLVSLSDLSYILADANEATRLDRIAMSEVEVFEWLQIISCAAAVSVCVIFSLEEWQLRRK